MVHTNGFVGKQKVKDQWEDGGFIVESQLEDWPIYRVKCLTSDDRQKPKYWILHWNCYCSLPMRMHLTSQVKHKPRRLQLSRMPPCTKPWTQMVPEATQSPPDLIEDEVSDPESALSDSEPEGT